MVSTKENQEESAEGYVILYDIYPVNDISAWRMFKVFNFYIYLI